MPQSIISQFDRKFSLPVETYRSVANISALNAIPTNIRWEGMFVYVIAESTTYELKGGVDNTFWEPIAGLPDAPSDGEIYGRKDGNWELVPNGGGVWGDITGTLSDQTDLASALNGKSDLTGATFTGAVNVPDQAYGSGWNGSTQVPTKNAIYDKINTLPTVGGVSSVFGRSGDVTAQEADYAAFYAKLSEAYANPSWITSLDWSKITGISLATVATSGSYDDLEDKPTIPGTPDEEEILGSVEVASVSGTKNLDLAAYAAFVYTLTGATTLTESNTPTSGKSFVRNLIITGNYTLTYPASWTRRVGGYSGTKINLITISYINSDGTLNVDVIITQMD